MSPELAVTLIYRAVLDIIIIVSIMIVPSLIVGLIVSVFQAATQVNEQTLSFLPRLLVTLAMLAFAGHWILERLMDAFHTLFITIPGAVG